MALVTYDEARPWARSIAEEVLERRMPPWNPVKGFGEFKHEAGLSQEEIGLIAEWVEGGAPRGEDRYLPAPPPPPVSRKAPSGRRVPLSDGMVLSQPLMARGIVVTRMEEGGGVSVWAELPDGGTVPLLEIGRFRAAAQQPYEFAEPRRWPAGTRIHVEGTAGLALISSDVLPERRSGPSAPRPRAAPAARRDGRPGAER